MIRIYKCPGCGFNLVYSGKSGAMVCSHCDTKLSVAEVEAAANDGRNLMTGPEFTDDGTGKKELHCPSCGVTMFTGEDANTSATVCGSCDQPSIIESRLNGEYRPKYIIPFAFDKKQAKEKFKAWSKKGKLTPSSFRTDATLDKMKGVYIPAWFFSYTVDVAMTIEAEKKKTEKSASGEITTEEEFLINLETEAVYERVPFTAEETVTQEKLEILEPYDYSALTDFALPYLSGYFAEKFHFTADELEEKVKDSLKKDLEEQTKAGVTGYDSLKVRESNAFFRDRNVEYVLLPVWVLRYEYGRKKFPIFMNGQSGKIDGKLPVSMGKVLLLFGIVFAVVLLALLIIGWLK